MPPELLQIGKIDKPHGLRGEVVVSLVTNRLERMNPGSVLYAGATKLVVTKSSPHTGRYIVSFKGVYDRAAAQALAGEPLMAEALDDPDVLWVHRLIGAVVVDKRLGVVGTVAEVIENPASDLIVLEGGKLIPMRFVEKIVPLAELGSEAENGIETLDGVDADLDAANAVVVDLPDGLLDLN